MSDGAGGDKSTRALSPPRRRAGAGSPPLSPDRVETVGGIGPTVLVAGPDEVRAVYLAAARHRRAQEALLELLTQPDLKERRLAWEMLSKLGISGPKDGGPGGAPTQIVIQNHLPVPPRTPSPA